mgnify:CR=1 FL=1
MRTAIMTELAFIDGEGWENHIRLNEVNQIGRHPSRDVQVLDQMVSRHHAVISWADNDFWLQDLSSKNGTFLNGGRVFGPVRLRDGDVITVGETLISFISRLERVPNLRPEEQDALDDDSLRTHLSESSRDWNDSSIDSSSGGFFL